MLTATIIKDGKGIFHVRLSKKGPQTGGDVKIIEVLLQKDGEEVDAFRQRCQRFIQARCS